MEAVAKEWQDGLLVLGTNSTLKLLRAKKISMVYITTSTPDEVKKKIEGVEIKKLKMNATDLGKTIGKDFPISICGVKK
jgi:ribosomal protein L30E